jgi:protein-tyrosine phosphatase
MIDGEISRAELNQALVTSNSVARALVSKQRVLVTCAMGINRSAFVAALALARITRLSADQLVTLMRTRRDNHCLSNEHFRGYLQKFVGAGRRR